MSLIALQPRGWRGRHPPVILFDAREDESGLIEAQAAIVTHAIRARTLFGTWYFADGRKRRVRVRWEPNTNFGMTEEVSYLEQV